jgi:hypothetical protein
VIVEIPFRYRLEHLPPRKRRPVVEYVPDVVHVQIDEFSPEEAPLAFASPGSAGFDELPAAEIRLAGGVLVAPVYATSVGLAEEDNARVWATRDTLAALVRTPAERRNPFVGLQNGGDRQGSGTAPDTGRSTRISADREACVAAIQRAAAGWVFVGGAMCRRRIGEPVWHVISRDRGDRKFVAVVARRHPGDPDRRWPGAAIYRADRLDAALAHARRRAAAIGVEPDSVSVDGRIEVAMGSAVRFDDEDFALVEAAREAAATWRPVEGAHLAAEMAAFDLAIAEGRGNEDTARAVESLVAWLDDNGLGEFAGSLRELVERREGLPETAARRAADADAALAAAYVDVETPMRSRE